VVIWSLAVLLGLLLVLGLLYRAGFVREALMGWVGNLGAPAVGFLRDAMEEDDDAQVRQAALTALRGMGPPAAAALRQALRDRDAAVRARSVRALYILAFNDPDAAPDLIAALADPSTDVRFWAVRALCRAAPQDPAAVAAVARALRADADRGVRHEAAASMRFLWGTGSDARTIVPALVDALRDPDADVRLEAAESCERIGPMLRVVARDLQPQLQQALRRALDDPDERVRKEAAEALEEVSPDVGP
jgi:HEAT repeat protein